MAGNLKNTQLRVMERAPDSVLAEALPLVTVQPGVGGGGWEKDTSGPHLSNKRI